MSYSEHRIIRARKSHRCLWCSEHIECGKQYALQEWADGNQHGRSRYHMECMQAIQSLSSTYDGQEILEWWIDEGCVPDFQRGYTYEVEIK